MRLGHNREEGHAGSQPAPSIGCVNPSKFPGLRSARLLAISAGILAVMAAGLSLPVNAATPAAQPRAAETGTNGSWSALGGGFPSRTVYAIARGNDDTVYMGGTHGLAAWSPTQQSLTSLSVGGNIVYELAVASDDSVYMGGPADLFNKGYVARWSPDTSSTAQLGALLSSGPVRTIAIKDDTLYLGGDFTSRISQWGPLSSSSAGLAPLGAGLGAPVLAIDASSNDDSIYIGGGFTQRIVQWGPITGSPAYAPVGTGLNDNVRSIRTSRDDTVFIAGVFTKTGDLTQDLQRVAMWSPTSGYQPLGLGLSGGALAIALDDTNSLVYAGGYFDYACGSSSCSSSDDTVPLGEIGAFDLRTQKWVPLTVNGSSGVFNGYVLALLVDDTGVYLGGSFPRSMSGTTLDSVAKWTWAPPSGNSTVYRGGNGPVVIPGQSFVGVSSVKIAGIPAAIDYAQSSSTQLTVTPPNGPGLGDHDIEVTAIGGTARVGTYRIALPSAPAVTGSSSAPTSAGFTWTLNDTGGSSVYYQIVLDDTNTIPTSTNNTSITLTGLSSSTTYNAYVRAVNANGPGPWSAPATVTTQAQSQSPTPAPPGPAPASPPGAPTGVSATGGNSQATVTWTPPVDSGTYPISGYVVRAQPGGQTCSTASTSCTVTGLTNGTAYTFTVTASSAAGQGPASAPSSPVTPRTVPEPPTAVTASPGVEQATLTWSPPANDGGTPITGYRVTTVPASAGCQTLATTCTITGLTAGQEYAVTVVAVNAAGDSAPSQAAMVTPRERPVILITGTRAGKGDAIVRVKGQVRGLDVATVQPFYRLAKQRAFRSSASPVPVIDGSFTWQRTTSKRITVYVVAGELRSNAVTIPGR